MPNIKININGMDIIIPVEVDDIDIADEPTTEEERKEIPDQDNIPVPALPAVSKADELIELGKKYLGVPYKLGAKSGQTDKFDCSSFVQYLLYKVTGQIAPRTARPQSKLGKEVKREEIVKGDLVFFSTMLTAKKYDKDDIKRIGHVGIYAGRNEDGIPIILHTYKEGVGVVLSKVVQGNFWDKHFVKAKRVL